MAAITWAISGATKVGKMVEGKMHFPAHPQLPTRVRHEILNWRHLINPPVQRRGPLRPVAMLTPAAHGDHMMIMMAMRVSLSPRHLAFQGLCLGLDLVKSGSYFYALLIDSRLEQRPCLTSYFMFMNAFLL